MFELKTPTDVKLAKFSPRIEKHGKDEVSAATLRLMLQRTGKEEIDAITPGLFDALFKGIDGQDELPGVETRCPLMRCPAIQSAQLKMHTEGATLKIDHGIDASAPMVISGCKVDAFAVDTIGDESVIVLFNVGSSDISEEEGGWLFGHQRQMMRVQLLAPGQKLAAIDGSTEAFKADHPGAADGQADLLDGEEAGEAFARLQEDPDGGPGEEGGADSEGGTTDADPGAAEQAEIEAGMRESLAAAGLREKPARRGRKVAAVE